MEPTFPAVVVNSAKKMVWPEGTIYLKSNAKLLLQLSDTDKQVTYYDSDSTKYKIERVEPINFTPKWWHKLVWSIYNPSFEIKYTWQNLGKYTVDELRTTMLLALSEDDNVICQFHDKEDIGEWFKVAISQEELITALYRTQERPEE